MEFKNSKITVVSPAKINLHLEILGKRKDGYHELAMLMQSINLEDYLEIELNASGSINLSSNNNELDLEDDNLIIKTANILRSYYPHRNLGANIFLNKNIPIGAGLAGGSSNAAATLIGLNKLWALNLDQSTLAKFALKLGSDVPFFLEGGSQYCFGRGEILEKYRFDSRFFLIILKNPKVSLSTSEIYKKYCDKFQGTYLINEMQYEGKRNNLRSIDFTYENFLNRRIKIRNDLQKIVQNENKSVSDALTLFSQIEECICFSMSGSGPSCYGLFNNYEIAKKVYEKNKKLFLSYGYDSWLSEFQSKGIKIL